MQQLVFPFPYPEDEARELAIWQARCRLRACTMGWERELAYARLLTLVRGSVPATPVPVKKDADRPGGGGQTSRCSWIEATLPPRDRTSATASTRNI